MRATRLLASGPLTVGAVVDLDDRATRHVAQVLRLGTGDPVVLFDGRGGECPATLVDVNRQRVRARIDADPDVEPGPALRAHVALGLSRADRLDYALQKAVELGASAISVIATARSVVRLDAERAAKRMSHWQGIVIGACEQSGRSWLPGLDLATDLAAWLDAHPGGILLDPAATRTLPQLPPPANAVRLLVGPEGGLNDAERDLARAAGYVGVRLGPRILRTETAPLAALAAMQMLWGDFR
jgi:16S rRNA (uracil1498-N3)-methyltransferase